MEVDVQVPLSAPHTAEENGLSLPVASQTTAEAELLLNLGTAVDSRPNSPLAPMTAVLDAPAEADPSSDPVVDSASVPLPHTPPDDLDPKPSSSESGHAPAPGRSSTPPPRSPGPPPGSVKKRKQADMGSSHPPGPANSEALPPHYMGEDNVIIRCICGFTEDDGFTIQCEGCYAWQHGQCFGYRDEAAAPEIYFCELCEPREVNVDAAVQVQLESRREFQLARLASAVEGGQETKEVKGKARGKKRQRTASVMEDDAEDKDGAVGAAGTGAGGPAGNSAGVMGPPSVKPKRKQPGPKPKPRPTPVTTPISEIAPSVARQKSLPPVEVEDPYFRIEPWTFDYTPARENIVRGRAAKLAMAELYRTWVDDEDVPDEKRPYRTASGLPSPTETGIVRFSPDRHLVAPNFAILGAPVPPVIIKAPNLASIAALVSVRAVSNPFSFLPLSYAAPPASSLLYTGPPVYAVYAGMRLGEGSFVGEMAGEVLDCKTYRRNPINQYGELGLPKPFVHALGPPAHIILDSRAYGSDLRFIRSGCHPNAVLRPILHKTADLSATQVKFGVFTSCDVAKGDELVLGWEWDDQHVVHALKQLIMSFHPSCPADLVIPDDGISRLLDKFEQVLTALVGSFSTCACTDHAGCSIAQMRSLVKTGDVLRPGSGAAGPASHRKGSTASPASTGKLDLGALVGAVRGWRKMELEVERYRRWKKEERLGLDLGLRLKREPGTDGEDYGSPQSMDAGVDASLAGRRPDAPAPGSGIVPSPASSHQAFEDVSMIDIPPPMDRRHNDSKSPEATSTSRTSIATPRKAKPGPQTVQTGPIESAGVPETKTLTDATEVDKPARSPSLTPAEGMAEEGEPELDNETDEDVGFGDDARSDATSDTEPRSQFSDSEGEWDEPPTTASTGPGTRRAGGGKKKRLVLSPVAEARRAAPNMDGKAHGQAAADVEAGTDRKHRAGERGRKESTVSATSPIITSRSARKGKKNRIVSSPPDGLDMELPPPASAGPAARKPLGKSAKGRKGRVISSPVDTLDSPSAAGPARPRSKSKGGASGVDASQRDETPAVTEKRARVPDQAVGNMFEPEEMVLAPEDAAVEGVVPSEEAKMGLDVSGNDAVAASPVEAEAMVGIEQEQEQESKPESQPELEPKEPTPPPEPPKKVSLSEYLKNHKFRKESVPLPSGTGAGAAVAAVEPGFVAPVNPSPATEAVQAGTKPWAPEPALGIKTEMDVAAAQGGRLNLFEHLPSARTPATPSAAPAPAPASGPSSYAPPPASTPGVYSGYSTTPTPGPMPTPGAGVAGGAPYISRNEYFPQQPQPQPQLPSPSPAGQTSAYVPRQASASYVPRQSSMSLASTTPGPSEAPTPASSAQGFSIPGFGVTAQPPSAPAGPAGTGLTTPNSYVPRPLPTLGPSPGLQSTPMPPLEASPSASSLASVPYTGPSAAYAASASPSPSMQARALPEPTPSPSLGSSTLPPPPPGLPRAPPTGPRVPPTGPRGKWGAPVRPVGLPLNPLGGAGDGPGSQVTGGAGMVGPGPGPGHGMGQGGMRPPVPSPGPGLGFTARGGGGFRGGFRGGMGRGGFGFRGRGGTGRGM